MTAGPRRWRAATAATPRSSAPDGITDETLWTSIDDPALSPYRRSKPIAERAAWDFMAESGRDTELCAVLPGWAFGPVRPPVGGLGSVQVPTQPLPDDVVRAAAATDPDLATLVSNLGHRWERSSDKARRLLGWTSRPAADAVEASARSLIEHRLV